MAWLRLLLVIFISGSLLQCAIRENLESEFEGDKKGSGVDDGSGKGGGPTKFCSPIEENGDKFPEDNLRVEEETLNGDGSATVVAGGCVHRSIREAWASLHNLNVQVWKAADRFEFTRNINPEEGVTHLYTITYFKGTPIGTIDWTMEWFHGVSDGTFEQPNKVFINYSRRSGTSNIPIWNGSLVLTRVSDTITSIAIENTFKARQSNNENRQSAKNALAEMIKDTRNGEPDWKNLVKGLGDVPGPGGGQKPITDFYCQKDSEGNLPSEDFFDSKVLEGNLTLVDVGACINRPVRELWAVLHNHEGILWDNADESTYKRERNPLPGLTHFYEIDYKDKKLFGSDDWKMEWEHQITDGNFRSPKQVLMSYKKVFGEESIITWTGEIVLTHVTDKITSLDIKNNYEEDDDADDNLNANEDLILKLMDDARDVEPDWENLESD